MSALARFFGGNPLWVVVRLIVLSVIVGVILVGVGLSPYELLDGVIRLLRRLWAMGFDAVEQFFEYFLIGAVVVFPIWVVMRLVRMGGGRGRVSD